MKSDDTRIFFRTTSISMHRPTTAADALLRRHRRATAMPKATPFFCLMTHLRRAKCLPPTRREFSGDIGDAKASPRYADDGGPAARCRSLIARPITPAFYAAAMLATLYTAELLAAPPISRRRPARFQACHHYGRHNTTATAGLSQPRHRFSGGALGPFGGDAGQMMLSRATSLLGAGR